jgi:hypothetical protein
MAEPPIAATDGPAQTVTARRLLHAGDRRESR